MRATDAGPGGWKEGSTGVVSIWMPLMLFLCISSAGWSQTPAPATYKACYVGDKTGTVYRVNDPTNGYPAPGAFAVSTKTTSGCAGKSDSVFTWNAIGPVGPKGDVGATGLVGATGAVGATGPAGAAGADGAPGTVGPAGAVGPVGPEGPVGAAGATGPIGPVGPVGPQGPAGPIGPDINLPGSIFMGGASNLGPLTVRGNGAFSGALTAAGADISGDGFFNNVGSRGDASIAHKLVVAGEEINFGNSRVDGTLIVKGEAYLGWKKVQATLTLAPGETNSAFAGCATNRILSGGYSASIDNVRVTQSKPTDGDGAWFIRAVNESATTSATITIYAICSNIGT